jgi:hypothetical protein
MAYISFKPTDYFNTLLYTGTGSGGSDRQITGVGFQPDFTWIKNRDSAQENVLVDSVRGATKDLQSNSNATEATSALRVGAFISDGFQLGTGALQNRVNGSGNSIVSWNWKAGTTSGISGGTITPSSYSINTTSGFGIYKYTGTGANGTIAHGLSSAPEIVIVKKISAIEEWVVGGTMLTSGAYKLVMNTTAAELSEAGAFNSTLPSSTVISLGTSGGTNTSTGGYIMYAFAPVKGYSQFGSYTGNGNVDGTFIYTGFKPAMFIAKESNAVDPWHMWNNKSSTSGKNVIDKSLQPNDLSTVATGNGKDIDFLANGVKLRTSNSEINASGSPYIYMAWAENPIVGSNGTAGVAR